MFIWIWKLNLFLVSFYLTLIRNNQIKRLHHIVSFDKINQEHWKNELRTIQFLLNGTCICSYVYMYYYFFTAATFSWFYRSIAEPIIIIAQDNSASMVLSEDSSFVKNELLQEINALKQQFQTINRSKLFRETYFIAFTMSL